MKRKKAALYTPYLDTLGGGERYALSLLKSIEDLGYDVSIFWDSNLSSNIKQRLDINFKKLNFLPNIFNKKGPILKKLLTLHELEIFLYVTDGSYFISTAKKNFVYAMVPKQELYTGLNSNLIRISNWKVITHSKFVQKNLDNWKIKSSVLYPHLSSDYVNSPINKLPKEKIILTVGRFFTHLHAKKHDLIIEVFKKHKSRFPDFKLVLAGGLKKEDEGYFKSLKKLSGLDKNIIFKTNLSYKELFNLYKKSAIYWHFAGFGIDDKKNPELTEHFGITPLEAMATGCITFVYNAGGPKEIVKDGKTGFVFNSEKELISKTLNVINNSNKQDEIRQSSQRYIKENFSYGIYKKNVKEVLKI